MRNLVSYTCIECGKESSKRHPSTFTKPREEYICQKCFLKNNNKNPDVIYKRSLNETWVKNNKLNLEKIHANPENIRKLIEGGVKYSKETIKERVTYKCIDCGKENTQLESYFSKPKEEYICRACYIKRRSNDKKWLSNISKSAKIRASSPTYIKKYKKMMSDMWENQRDKMLSAIKKRSDDPSWLEKVLISSTGQGFWYGHPSISNTQKTYCERWNRDLWDRIDAAWDYKSAISGKTKKDNNNKNLSRHHVYWQEKACCEWDEDKNGYYANINIGKETIKYYIKGDPNKFVLLTKKEHGMVQGNKKLGTDKITWIKFFEDLIEQREKEGKKCYLSKEEYEIYKIN